MSLKAVSIADDIRSNFDLAKKVELATEVLIDVLGESAARASVTWELLQDANDRPLLRMDLEEPWGSSMVVLVPGDFETRNELWWKLHRFWGDHLQKASRQHLERLHQLVLQLEDD